MSVRSPTEREWDIHKDIIRWLYMFKDKTLEGEDGVRQIMSKLYRFNASKALYEKHFQTWNFIKKLKKEEWAIVGERVKERHEAGKKSEVVFNGRRFGEEKVRKEIARNVNGLRGQGPEHIPPGITSIPPNGLTVCTPFEESITTTWTANLPFVLLDAGAHPKSHRQLRKCAEITSSIYQTGYTVFENCNHVNPACDYSPTTTSSSMENFAYPHNQVIANHFGLVIPRLTSLLPHGLLKDPYDLCDHEISELDTFRSCLNLLWRFSVLNNFAGLEDFPKKNILDNMNEKLNYQLFQWKECSANIILRSLAEKLFSSAIEAGRVDVLDFLLRHEYIDVNKHICVIGKERYTPVERSSMLGNVEITRLFLENYHADADKSFARSSNGALRRAFHDSKLYPNPELVKVILQQDLTVDRYCAERIFIQGDTGVVERVVELCLPEWSCYDDMLVEMLGYIVKYLDIERVMGILNYIELAGSELDYEDEYFSTMVLDQAAAKGQLDLVQMFLNNGARLSEWILTSAVKSRNRDLVKFLINQGASVKSFLDRGIMRENSTPLSEALRVGDMDLVDLFEQKGALENPTDDVLGTTLYAAVESKNVQYLRHLLALEHGKEVNSLVLGRCLQIAIELNEIEIAKMLIQAGADVNIDNSVLDNDRAHWRSPFSLAMRDKNKELALLILSANTNINTAFLHDEKSGEYVSALSLAVHWGDMDVTHEIISMGADVNDRLVQVQSYYSGLMKLSKSPLEVAVANGDAQMVRFLLDRGADPKDSGALRQAVSQGEELTWILLEEYCRTYPKKLRGFGAAAVADAITTWSVNVFEVLVEYVDVSAIFYDKFDKLHVWSSPLDAAIRSDPRTRCAAIEKLLQAGADYNGVSSYTLGPYEISTPKMMTPVLTAIELDTLDVVRLLISRGADVNLPATKGIRRTPLQKASEKGNLAMVRALLDYGAYVDAPPARDNGGTALQLAAQGGYIGIAELLIQHGANINARPSECEGRTALEGAAENGRIDMVVFLMNAGAEITGQYHRNYKRAVNFAEHYGHFALADLLRTYKQQRTAEGEQESDIISPQPQYAFNHTSGMLRNDFAL